MTQDELARVLIRFQFFDLCFHGLFANSNHNFVLARCSIKSYTPCAWVLSVTLLSDGQQPSLKSEIVRVTSLGPFLLTICASIFGDESAPSPLCD